MTISILNFELLLGAQLTSDLVSLVNDIIMETSVSILDMNTYFQIYADDPIDIINNNIQNLKFRLFNRSENNILPKIGQFEIVYDPINCGYLSEVSRKRTLGYEHLCFLSNHYFNTVTDYRNFVNVNNYINNLHQLINNEQQNIIISMNETPYGGDNKNISSMIYKQISNNYPERLLEITPLNDNWYGNFLKPGDILQYRIFIDQEGGKVNLNDETLVNNNNNVPSRIYTCRVLLT